MKPAALCSRECLRRSGLWLALLVMGTVLLGWISGCGKKADPLPLRFAVPPAVSDLKAEKKEQGIELRWNTVLSEGRYRILRSEQFPDEDICPDCPRHYVIIQELTSGDLHRLYGKTGYACSWTDTAVKIENSYFYRIVVCNAAGFCSELSPSVDVPAKRQSEVK